VSVPGDYDNGEIGGMIGRVNRSTRRKRASVPLCPPQTPHAARTRTRAAAVESQRLIAELRHGHVSLLRVKSHVMQSFKTSTNISYQEFCMDCCAFSFFRQEMITSDILYDISANSS
jgi:hypothetical protein